MVIERFPPVERADEYGLLAAGGDLEVESLLLAYRSGIFPWPIYEDTLTWFAPPRRAVLKLSEFHISKSLAKARKITPLSFTIDRKFSEVITGCREASNRHASAGTWISDEIVAGYSELHRAGYCHSIEANHGDNLVGGLYGVSLGKMFCGESMFYREPNASKLALCFLVDHLRSQGVTWIDCQVMTPLFKTFGAREITRNAFMKLLQESLSGSAVKWTL